MQPYTKVTNEYLIGRMAGNSGKSEFIPDGIIKYNNRYQLDKIKMELKLNWRLKLYASNTRGFYISFSLKYDDLIFHAEMRRKKYRENLLKEEIKQSKMKVLNSIYNNQN